MKRKIKIALLLFLSLIVSIPMFTACNGKDAPTNNDEDKTPDYFLYQINADGETYSIIRCQNSTIYAVVPSTYKQKPVTSIGDSAFCACYSLTSVKIPDGVTSIGDSAFYNCCSIKSIKIPDSVTSIGDHAFDGCSSLTNITIPDGVTSIGDSAFYDCCNLKRITISDSVTSIGTSAFNNCFRLTSITIPDSVTSIGVWAFSDCKSLTSITFEGTVKQWNDITFGDDWNINVPATEVICSDGVVKLN